MSLDAVCAQVVGVACLFAFIIASMLGSLNAYEVSLDNAELARQKRNNFPTTTWVIEPDQRYSCFFSHYKAEAGAEARYLKE
jgi:hypothetical protein